MTDQSLDEQMGEIARTVAARYYSRCWWADLPDLEQQAWTVVLEVLREYTPVDASGALDRAKFGAWAYVAAMRQLSRYLWRQSSPVSDPSDRLGQNLRGIQRAAVEEAHAIADEAPDPETIVGGFRGEVRAWTLVRKRIEELYTRMPWYRGPDVWLEATLAIYLESRKPAEVAASLGVDVFELYRVTEAMRAVMRRDRKLREHLTDLQQERID